MALSPSAATTGDAGRRSSFPIPHLPLSSSFLFLFSLTTTTTTLDDENQNSTLKKKTGALYDVCNSDALSLLEQETFDRVYSLVR